jgi:hypothetical protein
MPTKQRPYRVDYFDKHESHIYPPNIKWNQVDHDAKAAVLVHSVIVWTGTAKDAKLLLSVPGRFIIRAYRFYKKLSKRKVWKPYTPALAKIKECGSFAEKFDELFASDSASAAPLTVRGLGYGDQVEMKLSTLADCPTCQSTDKDVHRCTDASCLASREGISTHEFTACTDSWHVTNPEAPKLNDPVEAERDIEAATHYCPVCGSTRKEERGDIHFVNDAGKSEIESCKNPWHDNVFDWTDISKSKIEDLSDPLEKQASDQPPCNQPSFQLADEGQQPRDLGQVLAWAAIFSGAIVIAATLIYTATR